MILIASFAIPGTMPGLNDYIAGVNRNRHVGNAIKQKWTNAVALAAHSCQRVPDELLPIWIEYMFYERNRRRDKDNIEGFAKKVIQDGLVRAGVLENDGWKHIDGSASRFCVDAKNPRVEIKIYTEAENVK